MQLILALNDVVLPHLIAVGNNGGEKLADALRSFVAPLFLLAISLVACSFLVKRQMTQFLQFIAIAVGVAVFFYVPGVVEGLARFIADTLK